MHKTLVRVGMCALAFGAPLFASGVAGAQGQPAAAEGKTWSATIETEARYFSFESTRGSPALSQLGRTGKSTGEQLMTPWGITIESKPNDKLKIELLARSGYIWSKQSTTGSLGQPFSAEYESLTDTTLGGTFTVLEFAGFQPFFSLNVNAPTGRGSLKGNAAAARLDQDVAGPPTFGEGWNIGATVGVNIPITAKFMLSLGVGQTKRGEFDREGDLTPAPQQTVAINPGDVYTYNASLAWKGEQTTIQGQASYSYETRTTYDGIDFYRSGDKLQFGLGLQHAWTGEIISRVTGTYGSSHKNDVRFASDGVNTALIEEAFNSNSNVYNVSTDLFFKVGSFYVGPTVGYMYRDNNEWSSTAFQFLPAKTKWSAGGLLQGNLTNSFSVSARAERVWITENQKPNAFAFGVIQPNTGYPETKTDVWQVSVGGSFKF